MRATLTLWLTALLGIGCGSDGNHSNSGAGGSNGLGASSGDRSGSETPNPAEVSPTGGAPSAPDPEATGIASSNGGRSGNATGGSDGNDLTPNGDQDGGLVDIPSGGGRGGSDSTSPDDDNANGGSGGNDTTPLDGDGPLGGNGASPGGDDPPDMDLESSGGEPPADRGGQTLSFAADIWPVFDQARDPPFVYPGAGSFGGCTVTGVCHGGDRPGARLSMTDAQTAYDALLEVPSVSALCDGTIRVAPGEPEESCLIRFYEARLRDELDWVDDAEIDRVRRWIAQGALP